MITPAMLAAAGNSPDERRLMRAFRSLDPAARETLLAFADFLMARHGGASENVDAEAAQAEPNPEPRPAGESVVAAIKRLRRGYPMLDSATMLQDTASLMSAHVLQGRAADAVIDELEALFAARFEALRDKSS